MRIRSRSYNVPRVKVYHYTQWNNSVNPTADEDRSTTYLDNVETGYMEDVVTPQFKRKMRQGQIVNSPMTQITTFEKYSGGSLYQAFIQDNGGGKKTGFRAEGEWLGSIYQNPNRYKPAGSLDWQALRDSAVVSANAKAAANETEILATIGELNETISSLVSIFKRAVTIIIALKKLDMKRLAKEITPKELANRYMEARYAIRPLAYDVSNALKAFQTKMEPKRLTTRGVSTESGSWSDTYQTVGNMYYTVSVLRQTEQNVSARAGILHVVDHMNQLHVWGMDRIFTSAWELIPLSFVVDWFFNIGKLIAAWQPKIYQRTLASWVVVTTTTIQTCTVSSCVPLWPTSAIIEKSFTHSAMCSLITTNKVRMGSPTLPVFPDFNVRLDVLKLLDLGLIMRSLFS